MNSISKQSIWFYIGETLVEESKQHISAEEAVQKIREYMQMINFDEEKEPVKEPNDCISRQDAIDLWVWGNTDKSKDAKVVHVEDIEALPSADVVDKALYNQIRWERNVALEQLNELGYELGEKPKTGMWIPCKERYPSDKEWERAYCNDHLAAEFLVTIKGATRATSLYLERKLIQEEDGEKEYDYYWVDDDENEYEVIAWMPLPEPWEG